MLQPFKIKNRMTQSEILVEKVKMREERIKMLKDPTMDHIQAAGILKGLKKINREIKKLQDSL